MNLPSNASQPMVSMTRPTLALLFLAACGGAPTTQEREPVTAARLYPLEPGLVWSYNVDTGLGDPPTLAISQVVGAEGDRFEIQNNRSEAVIYERRPEGIWRAASGTWLLRDPIEVGAEWEGPGGRTVRITSIDETVETPNQRFEGCVRVEEAGGADGRRIRTVYCPDVGPVLVESMMQAQLSGREAAVRAVLLGYGSTDPG